MVWHAVISLTCVGSYNNICSVLLDLVGSIERVSQGLGNSRKQCPISLTATESYNSIGAVLSGQGDLERALKACCKALEFLEHVAGPYL